MSKGHQSPQSIKDDAGTNEPIDIELAEIFYRCYPALIDTIDVLLQPTANILENLIHDGDGKRRIVPLQIICEHCQESDTAILDLPRLRENFVKGTLHERIVPVELSDESQDFVNGLLCENIIDEMTNEQFHRCALLLRNGGTLGGIALKTDHLSGTPRQNMTTCTYLVICILKQEQLTLV